MGKTAVIYYSMSGNTDYVAKKISAITGADLIRISPEKKYPDSGFKKFLWGGKSAFMREEPELEDYVFEAADFDSVIIGTPVWASTFAPPVRTFIKENKDALKNKKLSVFVCFSGGGAEKAIEKLKKYLEIDAFAASLILIDPMEKETKDNDKLLDEFCNKITG